MNWEKVYQRQFSRVYRMCLFTLKNKGDAEDASQNIFLKYIKKQPEFNNLEHEKAWFIRVSKNECKDHFKLFWNKNRSPYKKEIPDINSKNETIKIDLINGIMEMPNKFKIILYLYYYEEYSVKEISKIIKEKESTIQSRLYHGRIKLKKILGEDYNER